MENFVIAQDLYLEVQHEIGYPHYRHIPPNFLCGRLTEKNIRHEKILITSNTLLSFDKFFDSIDFFISKSKRPDYWNNRVQILRKELTDKKLCLPETLIIKAFKQG